MADGKADSKLNKGYGYRELVVWKKGMLLAKQIYGITKRFPDEEKFGLVSQMRRAAVSVPSNMAEGQARIPRKNSFNLFPTQRGRWQSWTPSSGSELSLVTV